MKKIWACVLLSMLVMQACNNTEEQKKTVDKPVQLTGSWYKHFTGTIAGKAVDVNLCFNEGKTTGTYYYGNNGIAISISTGEDTTETDNNLYITEIAPTDSNGNNDYAQNPHWMVTLTGDKLVGKWISSDGKQTYLIDLKEDYPAGTYPFDIIVADSGASWGIASATASYTVCVPAASANKADKDFLDSVLKAGLDCKSNDYRSCLIQHNINYLNSFIEETDTTDAADGDSMAHRGETSLDVTVIYNKNRLVVFEALAYSYTGGAHGMYGASYTCADAQERRIWELKDIIMVDSAKLSALMEEEARRIFNIKPADSISSLLLVDKIPVTNNMYFTESGITFVYNPYEIASYAEGEISLFIPFAKLTGMLTPEFRKRMKL